MIFDIQRRNNSFGIMTKLRCEYTRNSGSIPGVGHIVQPETGSQAVSYLLSTG
jgi:hypothetical protein